MRKSKMLHRNAILLSLFMALSILMLITIPACGGESSNQLDKMVKAMEDNPRFSIRAGTVDSKGEITFPAPEDSPELKFILPDRISYYTEDSYESYPYMITIGATTYTSGDGVYWQEMWGTTWTADTSIENPYQLIKHAVNQTDKGTVVIDDIQCLVIEADVDINAWIKDNAPAPMLSIYLTCSSGEPRLDIEFLNSLGYEIIEQTESSIRLLREDVFIELGYGDLPPHFYAEVRNMAELTQELKQEFADIIESTGLSGCDLENTEPQVQGGEEYFSYLVNETTSMKLMVYADKQRYLPVRIIAIWQQTTAEGTQKYQPVIDIMYDETITIEKPEQVIPEKKGETLAGLINQPCGQLQVILNAFKTVNGVFPEKLNPEIVSEVMTNQGLDWPINPFTGAPIVEKVDSPGDYYYETVDDGDYCILIFYDYYSTPVYCYVPPEQMEPADMPEQQ